MATATRTGPKRRNDSFTDALGRRVHAEPLSAGLSRKGRATPPRVWELSRASLALLRPLLEAHGWPVDERNLTRALQAAQRAGDLDCSALVARYGARTLADRSFVVLPQLDDPSFHRSAHTFHCEQRGGVVHVLPPGHTGGPDEPVAPVALACRYFPFAGPQEDFHAACEFELLFGGAKGGTKTEAVVGDSTRYIEHSAYKAYIFRKTVPALLDINRRCRALFEALGATYTEQKKEYKFPSGALVILSYLNGPDSAEVVQGQEPTKVYIDESAQNPFHNVVEKIRAELRSPDRTMCRGLRETANPIGPGVPRLKKRYIAKCGVRGETVFRDPVTVPGLGLVTLERRFIPSKVTDNPVYRTDAQYMANLMTLTPGMRALLLDGDWSAAQGAYYPELDRAKHFIPAVPWAEYITLVCGFDWGFAHRWALVIAFHDEGGRLVVADTLMGRREQPDAVAERFKAWEVRPHRDPVTPPSATAPRHRRLRRIYASPGLFAGRAEARAGAITRAEEFAAAGFSLIQGDESMDSRRRKAVTLQGLLAWQGSPGGAGEVQPRPDRDPGVVFMDTPGNRILFAQLEMIVPDPDNADEPLKVDYDEDAVDEDGGVQINSSGDDLQDALWFLVDSQRSRPAKVPAAKKGARPGYDEAFDKVMAGLGSGTKRRRGD
jgi:hypothetical protein